MLVSKDVWTAILMGGQRMKNRISGLIMVIIILLAGCSTQETSSKPKDTPSEQLKPAPSPTATPPFTFAVTGDFKPFNYEQDGKLTGFDVELGEEIACRIGRIPQPLKIARDQLIPGLKEGKYQAVISSLSITPGRTEEIAFTTPYYVTGGQLFILEQNPSAAVEQLKDKRIGIIKGTPYMILAQNHTNNPKEYENYRQMIQDLTGGKIEAILTDKMIGLTAIKEEKLKIKPIGSLLYRDEVGIALPKSDQELLQKVNKAIEDMVTDGTYNRMSTKWFGVDISKE